MKQTIENLIALTDEELQKAVASIQNGEVSTQDGEGLLVYWGTRLQTLQQVLDIINNKEENVECITEVSQ